MTLCFHVAISLLTVRHHAEREVYSGDDMGRASKQLLNAALLFVIGCNPGCGSLSSARPQQHVPDLAAGAPQGKAAPVRAESESNQIQQVTLAKLQPPVAFVQDADRQLGQAEELTVDAVVEEVLARNPTLAQMTAAWQAASARYPQVTSLDDPSFDFVVAPASIGSNSVEFGYRIDINQKFPLWGKRGLRGQVALAQAGAAASDVNDVRLQLIESARTAFYDYYVVYRAQAVNDENLKLLREARKSAETRVSTGKANQQEVLQIDVEIGRQGERVLTLERMRQVAVARINTLMHRPPDSPLPPPPSKVYLPAGLPPVEGLRGRALEMRPDLRALSDRIAAEESSLALARKEYYPELMVGAAYDTIMGNGPMRDLAPQLSVGVNLPLRLAKRNAAVLEAQAKIMQRRAEFARLTDQVNFQVQEAYAQVVEAEKVVRLYEQTILPAAENNVKSAAIAYTAGQIPLLSYLEAQRNLIGLRDRYYQSQADYFQRRATLERAVGEPLASVA
jgi:outer membrane protein, heavy metal efflux system